MRFVPKVENKTAIYDTSHFAKTRERFIQSKFKYVKYNAI